MIAAKRMPVTGTVSADATDEAKSVVVKHIPGEAGIWILIFGDLLVFSVAFVAFLVARAHHPAVFVVGQQAVNSWLGFINAVVLMTSSVFLAWALRSLRRSRLRSAVRQLTTTMGLGLVFLTNKAIEYSDLVGMNHTPQSSEYFTYYYVLTGLHALHVVIGLTVLAYLWMKIRASEALTVCAVENGCCYWHFVDLLWLLLLPLLYLVA